MYTREQIINDIKRVAELKGTKELSLKEFELHSTIPLSTLKYYMGSWKQALKEAGLKPGISQVLGVPKSSDELLKELMRLYDETGEVPTQALVKSRSKFEPRFYLERWKSIGEAFLLARKQFASAPHPAGPPGDLPSMGKALDAMDTIADVDPLEDTAVGIHFSALNLTTSQIQADPFEITHPGPPVRKNKVTANVSVTGDQQVPKTIKAEQVPKPGLDPDIPTLRHSDSATMRQPAPIYREPKPTKNQVKPKPRPDPVESKIEPAPVMTRPVKTREVKFIPPTIKPRLNHSATRLCGDPIRFRGLRRAPANKQGVIYLFGMVAYELGFIVESVWTEYPDCEGIRCLNTVEDKWDKVRLHFLFKTSDFRDAGFDEKRCDIIVCWRHDWPECPMEVLELRSVITHIPDE